MSIPYLYRTVGLYTKFANYQNCRRQLSPAPTAAHPARWQLWTKYTANSMHRRQDSRS